MGFKPTKTAAAAVLAVALVAGPAASAAAPSKWAHYFDRKTGNVLVVKRACLAGEDSAAHLTVRDYRDHGGHVVIGCGRKGY